MNKNLCFKLAKHPSLMDIRAERVGFERSQIDILQAKNGTLCQIYAVEGVVCSALFGYKSRVSGTYAAFYENKNRVEYPTERKNA